MATNYTYVSPISVKSEYKPFNQVDFLVQLKNNSVKANSFRIVGKLKVEVNDKTAALDEKHFVFMNAFAGASSLFANVSTSINATQTIESIASFGRLKSMKNQAKYTLADLTSWSENTIELCGTKSNRFLLGEKDQDGYVSFCIKIDNCLNNMLGGDLHPSVVSETRLMITLESAMNAFYVNAGLNPLPVTEIDYTLKDLELHYTEVPAAAVQPIVFETHFLTQQSIVSKISSLSVLTGSSPADKISASFIKQRNRSKLTTDELMSEYVSDIERVEMDINSTTSVAMYPLQSYSDIANQYWYSFKQPNAVFAKNSITSEVTNGTCAFGIGFALPEVQADRLTMSIQIADQPAQPEDDPSAANGAIDAFVFCNSYIEL